LSYYKIFFENRERKYLVFKGFGKGIINYVTIKILKIGYFSVIMLYTKKKHTGNENYKKAFEKSYKKVIEKKLQVY
jgi:hypothetical protein